MVKNVEVKTGYHCEERSTNFAPRKKVFVERTTERDWREL